MLRGFAHRLLQFKLLLGFAALSCVMCLASECQAQRQRGIFGRRLSGRISEPASSRASSMATSATPTTRIERPADWRYNPDWRRDPSYFPAEPTYPKFYGGFHSSHFSNLGIPSGDIGFRGNGLYWTPW